MSFFNRIPDSLGEDNSSFSTQGTFNASFLIPLVTESHDVNVRVAVRVRPFTARELGMTPSEAPTPVVCVSAETPNVISILDPAHNFIEKDAFEFDQVLWSIPREQWEFIPPAFVVASQENVFDRTARSVVSSALDGYNCSVLAYGQTGSGKTYTMLGSKNDEGVIPRLVRLLFDSIAEQVEDNPYLAVSVELSFLEIYNEKVKDLLQISHLHDKTTTGQGHGLERQTSLHQDNKSLHSSTPRSSIETPREHAGDYTDCRVRFHPETGTFVEGLLREKIGTAESCIDLVSGAMAYRSTAATKMNAESSRSHAIFQLIVRQKCPSQGTQKMSIINLVDLAGSERITMSGVTGNRLVEAKNINLSLSTLRRVIDILIENSSKKGKAPKGVPPYRESMLTWILSDTLGGNSMTLMIATVSPHVSNIDDTVNTLRYALKAKAIVCSAKVNEERTAVVVGALRNEVDDLRRKLNLHIKTQNDEGIGAISKQLSAIEADYTKAQNDHHDLKRIQSQQRKDLVEKNKELENITSALGQKQDLKDSIQVMKEKVVRHTSFHDKGEMKADQIAEDTKSKVGEIKFTRARNQSLIRKIEHIDVAGAKKKETEARQKVFVRVFQTALSIKTAKTGTITLRALIAKASEKVKLTAAKSQLVQGRWAVAHFESAFANAWEEHTGKVAQLFSSSCDVIVKGMDAKIAYLTRRLGDTKEEHAAFLSYQNNAATTLETEKLTASRGPMLARIADEISALERDVKGNTDDLFAVMEEAGVVEGTTLAETNQRIRALKSALPELRNQHDLCEAEDAVLKARINQHEHLEALIEKEAEGKRQVDALDQEIAHLNKVHAEMLERKAATERSKTDVETLLHGRGFPANDNERSTSPTVVVGDEARPSLTARSRVNMSTWRPSLAELKRARHNEFLKKALYGPGA